MEPTAQREVLEAFRRGLRLESHVLLTRPSLTWQQLHNRLQWEGDAVGARLIAPRASRRRPWFRTRTPSRTSPGLLRILTGHEGAVTACAFSPDGGRIVSRASDGTVRTWDPDSGACLDEIRPGRPRAAADTPERWLPTHPRERATSPDGSLDVRVGGVTVEGQAFLGYRWDDEHGPSHRSGRVWLRDLRTGKDRMEHAGRGDQLACAFSPDARSFVTSGADGVVRVWDTSTRRCIRTLEGHAGSVHDCAFSPDGRWVVSAGEDGTVQLWDPWTGAELQELSAKDVARTFCALSPDARWLVVGNLDYDIPLFEMMRAKVSVWGWETGAEVRTLVDETMDVDDPLPWAFSRDGRRVVSLVDAEIRVWDAERGADVCALECEPRELEDCAFSEDGSRIVSLGSDDTFEVWDPETGALLLPIGGPEGRINAWDVSGDGRRIVVASDAAGAEWELAQAVLGLGAEPRSQPALTVWDAENGGCLRELRGHKGVVDACAFDADDRSVVSAGSDHTVRIWDTRTGTEVRTLDWRGEGPVSDLRFSPDGRTIACRLGDDTLLLLDVADGEEIGKPAALSGPIESYAFTQDGCLICASDDATGGAIRLWAPGDAEETALLPLPFGLDSVAVHPSGRVVCGGRDRALHRAELVNARG